MLLSDTRYTIRPVIVAENHESSVYNIIRTEDNKILTSIIFQDGPTNETSINGILHEHLIHVLIDRLEKFQEGPYKCVENEVQIAYLKKVLEVIEDRKNRRKKEGTYGTSKGN